MGLQAAKVLEAFKAIGVTHVVWLPDSETGFLYEAIRADGSIRLVPICREGEALAVAAGLWAGGARPLVLIQNTGLFESGDSVRGLGLDVGLPVVMVIGYRGWLGGRPMADSAGVYTEPILKAWGINYYLVETDQDLAKLQTAQDEAVRTSRPVAVLIGQEYER
jgi:sulfopyruvate decarboxylase TPP-binding subunit